MTGKLSSTVLRGEWAGNSLLPLDRARNARNKVGCSILMLAVNARTGQGLPALVDRVERGAALFRETGAEKLFSRTIVEALGKFPVRPWEERGKPGTKSPQRHSAA